MEELAFADVKGQHLIKWPPRSYCCSFCRREFKSAQALGGHMNVHRRDKARLKHSPIFIKTSNLLLQNPVQYNLGFDHNPVQFQVLASSSSSPSSSWSGNCEGEQVLKKQKSRAVQHIVMTSLCVDLKLQIADNHEPSDEKEDLDSADHNKKRPRTDDELEQAIPLLPKPDFDTYNLQTVVEINQISADGSTTEGLDLELRL